ncbi:MAG TPA: hypothetical protein VE127_11080 [Solirubrobacteraceae bacterium]|nr:hypothetical protein [Solirubrobacteraceae bacterium]
MRELTSHQIDTELAEQLPARELMNCCYGRRSGGGHTTQTNSASQGNTYQGGLINVNVSNDQVNILSAGNSNGGIYQANVS